MSDIKIKSEIYGNQGVFKCIRLLSQGLYQNSSKRIHVLGDGALVGKTQGTIYLDRMKEEMGCLVPERSLFLCTEDYFGLPTQTVGNFTDIVELSREKVDRLLEIIIALGFRTPLAIRSSSFVEDQYGRTFAGQLDTDFLGLNLGAKTARRYFADRLLKVINSAYSKKAEIYYRVYGYREIPPLQVIIQEVVGKEWQYVPNYFFPALAGIVNTARRKYVLLTMCAGMGTAAVKADCGARYYTISREKHSILDRLDASRYGLHYIDLANEGKLSVFGLKDMEKNPQLDPDRSFKDLSQQFTDELALQLADYALSFEKQLGRGIDLEWALDRTLKPSLVQLRPLVPLCPVAKPIVDENQILFSAKHYSNVKGHGEMTLKNIIYVDWFTAKTTLNDLTTKYPESLIVLRGWFRSDIFGWLLENILPYSRAIVLTDTATEGEGALGIDHFSLNCCDLGAQIIRVEDSKDEGIFLKEIRRRANFIESFKDDNGERQIKVYKSKQPLHFAINQEDEWGMVWTE